MSSNKTSNSKVIRIEKYRAMITGVQTNVGTKATIAILGTATAQPDIVSSLQGFIDAADATAAALAAYREAVAKQKLAAVAANGTYLGVKAYALMEYGNAPSTLGEFGLQSPIRSTPDVATNAHGEDDGARPGGDACARGQHRDDDDQVVVTRR
jgi:hypothetical protein